jgi:hypothetical protein
VVKFRYTMLTIPGIEIWNQSPKKISKFRAVLVAKSVGDKHHHVITCALPSNYCLRNTSVGNYTGIQVIKLYG